MSYNTPILFVVFKRVDTTLQVFNAIRKIRPKKLYIAADGHRESIKGEKQCCDDVKNIVQNVDWDCDVKYLFQPNNLGSALNVTQAISWVFEQEERCIILEDDTLPNSSFWKFMEEMLEKYKFEKRVMQVNGLCPYRNISNYEYSYTFSRCLFHCWGWGTWKESWEKFDFSMEKFNKSLEMGEMKIIVNPIYRFLYLRNIFKHRIYFPKSWDGRWVTSCLAESGLAILPSKNMVVNLGLNHQFASHTIEGEHSFENLTLEEISFPLKHPSKIHIDEALENNGLKAFFNISLIKMLKIFFKKPVNEISFLYNHFLGRT
ncbi:hypothetical protein VB796_07975 [Arcicella sp. LKC2W]|uniref:nucleotide-diphospho-sugar transferase n=1 Tax=Arcicella sp. LKC2W TaxID=2984198 RepID=UPI002B20CDA9|nr:nucleotide-diphospho-sugar transferase [Arcicella sp. LKC2W]MEA5458970.1 hypothetical protein [Arcicella sp. LKC2W]